MLANWQLCLRNCSYSGGSLLFQFCQPLEITVVARDIMTLAQEAWAG